MPVVELSVAEFAASQRKVEALNTRAVRRGWTGRLTLSGEQVMVRNEGRPLRFPAYPAGAEVVRVQARIEGGPACYAGWEFLAALDGLRTSNGETSWVVRCAPGVDASAVDRGMLRPGWCDHCRTVRPARRHLYAVRHRVSGEVKQVGSTCVKDFTGWNRAPVFLSEAEVLDELEQVGGGEDAFTSGYVVTVALAAVAVVGWVSRSLAGDLGRKATADLVEDFLVGRGNAGEAARVLLEPHLPAATAQAPTVIETVVEGLAEESDGYAANLVAVLRAEAVTAREVGLLASAPAAYQRILNQREEEAADPTPAPVWLGVVGGKVEVEGTVRVALTVDGLQLRLHSAADRGRSRHYPGQDVHLRGMGVRSRSCDRVAIAGTVKAHDLWHDQQQTVLSRPKRTDGGNGS